ncbi:unnamed protein product [Prunus armeniaca]|uniref:Uncharacterized protein n=1 Tax=Prunus armeniaca TaxID=36596 RepID=A0A6J5YCH3_PRUAR|nr:unnamed protein product [Prunus armeniaca]CAB4321244.1 unnamed protein product [Prunus armeniaca]
MNGGLLPRSPSSPALLPPLAPVKVSVSDPDQAPRKPASSGAGGSLSLSSSSSSVVFETHTWDSGSFIVHDLGGGGEKGSRLRRDDDAFVVRGEKGISQILYR